MIVFGFMGQVPNKVELFQWIKSPQVLEYGYSIEQISYLDKGFFSVRFAREEYVNKILSNGPLVFNRTNVCMILWEPMFECAKFLKQVHLVWVELVRLPCWLWDRVKDLVGMLGTPLFILNMRDLGNQSNRVCTRWDINICPLKQMVINVGVGLKVI